MTKEQIKAKNYRIVTTVYRIMDILHDPETGFDALRTKLPKNKAEYEKAKIDILNKITAQYGATPETPYNEKIFMLTGRDIMENHIYFSCGNAAKAFCYVNSKLPPNERLNLEIMLSTDMEHLVDSMSSHTVPVVTMADGTKRAIDPQVAWTETRICGPFIPGEIKIGKTIKHILPNMRGKEYKIVKLIPWHELETALSTFKNFLSACSVRCGETKKHCATLSYVLQNLDRTNKGRSVYNFCNTIKRKTSLPIRIVYAKNENGRELTFIMVKLENKIYHINPDADYLLMNRVYTTDGKTFTAGTYSSKFTTVWDKSPVEYIQWVDVQTTHSIKGRVK